ncbi:MAG TPA: VIT1/CCC1 transporter family protein [Nitrososphaerales archaeon]|nr:VIT1/CCC1 transporter family protein [Nitrososphaerales archaeon]
MPAYTHSHASEKRLADLVRQLVFGLGHGLISILGLSIGVASATGSTRTVAISGVVGMLTGLVALVTLEFLSARTQKQIFQHMIEEEKREFVEHPEVEKLEMRQYYVDEGFSGEEADSFVNRLSLDKDRWLKAHVTHVLEFIPGKTGSPGRESLTMGLSHILGATITLLPYLLLTSLDSAAYGSILLASVTLFAAGALKTRVAGGRWYVSGAEFLTLGMLAVIVGYLVGIAVADLA